MQTTALPHLAATLVLFSALWGTSPFLSAAHATPHAGSAPPEALALLTVNTAADENDGSCGDGDCSLRDAVALASSGDTIDFAGSLSGQTITLTLGEIAIGMNLTIDGSSLATPVTISGNDASRIFNISSGTVSLTALTITDGRALNDYGGAIINNGTLTMTNCTVSNSRATWDSGGIRTNVSLVLNNSTVSGNTSENAFGGGIEVVSGTLEVNNSTFSANSAFVTDGNAIGVSNASTATVRNSTLVGPNRQLLSRAGTTLHLSNTIVVSTTLPGSACRNDGAFGTNVNNLIPGGTCSPTYTGDPNLGPLADNGGPTQTFLVNYPSEAIDNGDAATCAALPGGDLDQRGTARVGTCDIGAVEFTGARPASLAPTDGPAAGGTVVTITGTDFTGATGVIFGGAAGTGFSVDGPTEITVTTPAGSLGAVDVVVQHAGGDGTLADGFTYVALPVTLGPVDGLGDPVPEPVDVPGAGQTEVEYAGTITNPTPGPLTIDGWPVITMPDLSMIVRRRPTVYNLALGASVNYGGAFNMLASFPAGTYTFTYNLGTHPAVVDYADSFGLVKGGVPKTAASGGRDGRAEPMAVRAAAALSAQGADEWIAVAAGEDLTAAVGSVAEDASDAAAAGEVLPGGTALGAAYPNPFNPMATVPFQVAEAGVVRLSVYDVLGREVVRLVDGRVEAGSHTAVFDASRLPSGTYLVRFTAAGQAHTQRLTLLK